MNPVMMKEDDHAVPLLQQLLRINTTNPPGDEEEAVLFLEAVLKEAGISSEIYQAASRRANLLARIKGKRRGKPIILLNHVDVVPADQDEWDADPFGGEIRDGYIYGRGAIDMKSQTICQLLAFINLHKKGITPERDIIFLATGDEEVGGKFGAEYMVSRVEELKDASFVLSEGGWITDDGGITHAQVSVAEKSLAQFFIRADGTGGHGSMPRPDNANVKVVEAARTIAAAKWPLKPTRIVSAYMNGLFKGMKGEGFTFRNLKGALELKGFRRFVEANPVYNALLRNTVTLTVLRGGEKVNVIPSESSAYFDARLLPGENYGRFMKKILSLAGKEVEVVPISGGSREPVPSGYATPYFKSIVKAVKATKGPLPVLPFITTGATDLRYFREFGAMAYGFFPVALPREELLRMHGVNERISIAGLKEGLKGMKAIAEELATLA
jgi:acetylornithine deacetylase/succinyl-diaminopimelate desuccinylase-like protein